MNSAEAGRHVSRDKQSAGWTRSRVIVLISLVVFLVTAFGCLRMFGSRKKGAPKGPMIDIVFDLDCTGSMASELREFQSSITDVMKRVKCGTPAPYVRFGLSGYRDKCDDYLVFKYDMEDNPDVFKSYVDGMRADGGGDRRESINESLHTVLNEINWNWDKKVRKIVLLIGDAGPHTDYHNGIDYPDETDDAVKKGITIYTIGCSGIEEDGERELKAIAERTGGSFHYLTYRQSIVDSSGASSCIYKSGKNWYSRDEAANGGGDWKISIEKDIAGGTAKSVKAPPAISPLSIGKPAPGSAQMPREKMGSNIGEVCVKIIRKEMERMGIRFDAPSK